MRVFQGCVEGREIAMTRKGANPHTQVLVAKTAPDVPVTTTTEPTDMTPAEVAKTMKTALAFDDVTKAYFLGLAEDASVAFLAKSADEQKAEAATAKAAADKVIADAEAAKSGKTQADIDLQKRFDAQQVELDALKADRVDRDLEKRARDEFGGYPGGLPVVLPLLKSAAKLPEADRLGVESVLKAQSDFAKRAGGQIGLGEDEINKAAPAQAELVKKAKEVAAEKHVSEQVAQGMILADPANADLFSRVRAEQLGAN